MKNSKKFQKIEKNGKKWQKSENLKLPMKFIEKQKTRVTRLLVVDLTECTFRPKKKPNF
jgi:hypothetical protein